MLQDLKPGFLRFPGNEIAKFILHTHIYKCNIIYYEYVCHSSAKFYGCLTFKGNNASAGISYLHLDIYHFLFQLFEASWCLTLINLRIVWVTGVEDTNVLRRSYPQKPVHVLKLNFWFFVISFRWMLCWREAFKKCISLEGKHWSMGGKGRALWGYLELLDWWWSWLLRISTSKLFKLEKHMLSWWCGDCDFNKLRFCG